MGRYLRICAVTIVLGVGCSSDDPAPNASGVTPGSGGPPMTGPGVGAPPTSVPGTTMLPAAAGPDMRGPMAMPNPAAAAGGSAAPASAPAPSAPTANKPSGWFVREPIPESCHGLPLKGMLYSPGGTTLPDKCNEFHPTYNNPWAVRCIDAWPHYDSGYAGDEYCILPPPPDQGIQVGYHPQEAAYFEQVSKGDMSGYRNASGKFILGAGKEETDNYRSLNRLETERNYYRIYMRMRTGSHHNIITLHSDTTNGGWAPDCVVDGSLLCDTPGFISPDFLGVLGGQQRPDDNIPASLDKPTEDKGMYLVLPQNPTILFNLHHFNSTEESLLKESWINIWWEQDATLRVYWMMGLEPGQANPVGYFSMRPEEVKDFHFQWDIANDYRVIQLLGHRHLWTTNFTVWVERQGNPNDSVTIYQSRDWLDMPTFRYDSVAKNPPIDATGKSDGAYSGPVELKRGDQLHFNCHQEFTNQRAREAGPSGMPTVEEIGRTRFANEVYAGEMCILFGTVTNIRAVTDLPARSAEPTPNFAR